MRSHVLNCSGDVQESQEQSKKLWNTCTDHITSCTDPLELKLNLKQGFCQCLTELTSLGTVNGALSTRLRQCAA
eukprot:6193487-Pleurochrysis_carterae.AAC.4